MVEPRAGRLLARLPRRRRSELIEALAETAAVRVERIVSTGQASPPGFWYDQDRPELVVVLVGRAGLRFADERRVRRLGPGDWVDIPAHARHRVEWTDAAGPTVWLAIHYAEAVPARRARRRRKVGQRLASAIIATYIPAP